jgi:7,8-dihydro-6-hydroxymethylpterin-pyrophosphokinase
MRPSISFGSSLTPPNSQIRRALSALDACGQLAPLVRARADCSPADSGAASANLVSDFAYGYLNRLAVLR